MQHLLGKRAPVVELDQEIFQEAGGKVSEGSGVTQVVGLLVLQLQQVVHLRPLTDAVANSLVVRGDCDQASLLLLTVFPVRAESLQHDRCS